MKILLLTLLPALALASFSYEGYKVYQLTFKDHLQAAIIPDLMSNPDYDFFTDKIALNRPVDIMVTPSAQEEFTQKLTASNIQYKVINENVEKDVKVERERLQKSPKVPTDKLYFREFHRFDVLIDFMYELQETYPDIVSVEEFGRSTEGRPLVLARVGTGNPNNPTIIMDGGIHAREWISPAVTTLVLQELITDPAKRELIENINWIIVPVLNPDGYEYTWTDQRLWRKTRRIGIVCNGVDANRNFDIAWGQGGASNNECSETFMGPYVFSEPEARALATVAGQTANIVGYLTMHSYGNWLLYSWGFTNEPVENAAELQALGNAMSDAIYSYIGTRYTAGATADLLYYASGTSQDWFTAIGVPLSYTVELPAGEGTGSGFIISPERILPVGSEFLRGLVTYANHVIQRYRTK